MRKTLKRPDDKVYKPYGYQGKLCIEVILAPHHRRILLSRSVASSGNVESPGGPEGL